jgi:ketosteroid isomerase-like protein
MVKHRVRLVVALLVGTFAWLQVSTQVLAQNSGEGAEAAIRAVLAAQVAAWNRGDIPVFMESYENLPETTFIGTAINKGFGPILERYKKAYSTHDQMGALTFNDMDVRLLPTAAGVTEYAVVTGRFHLERTAKGAATKDDGIFSLVWHKGVGGWKILLDHTS